jgi:short subunit dehydrogenase-like uncharacterized protein
MIPSKPWLLYGANGYTGELIAREAVRRGMHPILAGRSRAKIEKLADELQCHHAVFDLDDHTTMVQSLQGIAAVLNCAGPFSRTARSMMQACLATHIHYLDITGEIEVFELAHSVHEKAERAGIVLCPGVGFDVVPTDCIALKLKQSMPDATHLALGFDGASGLSKGTAKTTIEAIGAGARVRRDGKIVSVPLASQTRRIDFGRGERDAVGIAWGDVSTAYYTTGIPNIDVFIASSPKATRSMRRGNLLRPLLRQGWMQGVLKFAVDKRLRPPTQAERDNNPTYVWGEVRNAAGRTLTARLRTLNGYALTVTASLGIMAEILTRPHPPGFTTPAKLMGADYVTSLANPAAGFAEIRIDP